MFHRDDRVTTWLKKALEKKDNLPNAKVEKLVK